MKVGTVTGANRYEVVEFDEPGPSASGVIVDIDYCGVCGTDVASYRTGDVSSPALFGHEWTGRVRHLGPAVTGLAEGDRVVVGVAPPCGRCRECRSGRPHTCRVVYSMTLGLDRAAPVHGGFAEAISVAADRVVRADPGLSAEQAALVEPAAVAYHAVRRSGVGLGDIAVVQGAGPVGLLVLQLARLAGAAGVVVIEPADHRRRLALELGADVAVSPGQEAVDAVLEATEGSGGDVVFECAGLPRLVQDAVGLTRRDGVTAMIGHTDEPATINPAIWLGKDIRVVASMGYEHHDFRRTMGLIVSGRLRVSPLHSRTVGLEELGTTLAALAAGSGEDTKVLVDPRHTSIRETVHG